MLAFNQPYHAMTYAKSIISKEYVYLSFIQTQPTHRPTHSSMQACKSNNTFDKYGYRGCTSQKCQFIITSHALILIKCFRFYVVAVGCHSISNNDILVCCFVRDDINNTSFSSNMFRMALGTMKLCNRVTLQSFVQSCLKELLHQTFSSYLSLCSAVIFDKLSARAWPAVGLSNWFPSNL